MHYSVSNQNPQSRYFKVSLHFSSKGSSLVILKQSNWRPGRYELGNFSKYVRDFKVFDKSGNELPFKKLDRNTWQIESGPNQEILVTYQFYGYGIDAGSSFCADTMLYLNPVNCLMYQPEEILMPCSLTLEIPVNWEVATALPSLNGKNFTAADFHEMADSPIIASPNLDHLKIDIDGVVHHIWAHGTHSMDLARFGREVGAYTREQVSIFGEFPASDFHYLIHFLPHAFRHGVEHSFSTVIVNGPGEQFHEPTKHNDMLAICSHELFHFWNVKRLRPAEMWPYNYEQENYARTGYIYEGITTYYGDYALLRCGVFSFETWSSEFCKDLKRHFENDGRHYYSVAESSFDTWLDGYANIAPARKTSIYVEGMLAALLLDIELRRQSNHSITLDTYMRRLYQNYYKEDKGYTEDDLVKELSELAGKDMRWFFERFYWGKGEVEKALRDCLLLMGLELKTTPSRLPWERYFGIKTTTDGRQVILVLENSPAADAGIAQGDFINYHLGADAPETLAAAIIQMKEAGAGSVTVAVHNVMGTEIRELQFGNNEYLPDYQLIKANNTSKNQTEFFEKWSKQGF